MKGVTKDSRQGDVRLVSILESMGCEVSYESDGISVSGGKLYAVEVDMSDMPDVVPTLGVVAAFAEGTTKIKNVGHLKEKECDRLNAVATELGRIGVKAAATDTGLEITGGITDRGHGKIEIETYNDHRIAMCFAIAGLVVPGIVITNEKCVEKSFPNFWEVFEGLY